MADDDQQQMDDDGMDQDSIMVMVPVSRALILGGEPGTVRQAIGEVGYDAACRLVGAQR